MENNKSVELQNKPAPKVIDVISNWIIRNRSFGIIIGIICIIIGLVIEGVAKHSYNVNESQLPAKPNQFTETVIFCLSHFFIIFGEATFALFFLQIVIENKNSETHRENARKILEDQQHASTIAINQLTGDIDLAFRSVSDSYITKSDEVTQQLKENLFKAILGELIPHQFVDRVIGSNFFKTDIIKRNTIIEYDFTHKDQILTLIQNFSYDLENCSQSAINFDMDLELTDTSISNSQILECGTKKNNEKSFKVYDIDNDFKKVRDLYKLNSPVLIQTGEILNVWYKIKIDYTIKGEQPYITDYFYSIHHLLDLTLIFKLPDLKHFTFELIPAFANLPEPEIKGNMRTYSEIRFLAIGQGFSFTLEKKDENKPKTS